MEMPREFYPKKRPRVKRKDLLVMFYGGEIDHEQASFARANGGCARDHPEIKWAIGQAMCCEDHHIVDVRREKPDGTVEAYTYMFRLSDIIKAVFVERFPDIDWNESNGPNDRTDEEI